MGRIIRALLLIGIILQLSSLPAHAYWKHKVAVNEKNAAEYIEKLKSGEDPDRVRRPTMRFIEKYEAKQEQKRFLRAMDEAEKLAREGRPKLIPDLKLNYQDLEKDREVTE